MKHKMKIEEKMTLLRNLAEFTVEATPDVEQARESLLEMGVDPDELVSNVKARIETFLDRPTDAMDGIADSKDIEIISVLGEFCDITGLGPGEIADELGVTVPFLLDLEQHPKQVHDQWYREVSRRAAKRFPQVTEEETMRKYKRLPPLKKAASRSSEYSKAEITAEDILGRSEMSDEDKLFWKSLVGEDAR